MERDVKKELTGMVEYLVTSLYKWLLINNTSNVDDESDEREERRLVMTSFPAMKTKKMKK